MKRALATLFVLAAAASACLPEQDDPTTVKDLRVLGITFDPPEIMFPCDPALLRALAGGVTDGGALVIDPALQQQLALFAGRNLKMKTLIADPRGGGRELSYRVLACANTGDRECDNEGDFVELKDESVSPPVPAKGKTDGGSELALTVKPGLQFLDDGNATPLLFEVVSQDTFKGLGGIRVPVVVEVKSPDGAEHVFAQKLMVYSCQFFRGQKANVTPVLPGILFKGEPWPEDEVKQVSGTEAIELEPIDFSSLEEPYVLPSIQLQPVSLTEAWKVTWMTTSGTMSPYETGGFDFAGESGRHKASWTPDRSATTPQDVTFYFVVRDGRGGQSWLTRRAHWTP